MEQGVRVVRAWQTSCNVETSRMFGGSRRGGRESEESGWRVALLVGGLSELRSSLLDLF
jgi:hypothetical protein